MKLKERIKLFRILWQEAKGLEKMGIVAKASDYPAVFGKDGEPIDPTKPIITGDGKAKYLADFTKEEFEDYQEELQGWKNFKDRIKKRINQAIGNDQPRD